MGSGAVVAANVGTDSPGSAPYAGLVGVTDSPKSDADAFFGRDGEMLMLVGQLTRALAGLPSLVLLVGEAGIGKTRLVAEIARIARARGVRVLHSDATEGDRAPFRLWSGIGLPPATDEVGTDVRWELLDVLATKLAEAAPVLVATEDIHWADEPSLWVLERMVHAVGGAPVLVIATARRHEEGQGLSSVRRAAEVIEVAGLDRAATKQLVEVRSQRVDMDVEELWRRTAGNPLFLRELLLLGQDEGLPGAVTEVLDRLLGRLPPATRFTLAALAAAGTPMPLDVVARAVGTSTEHLLDSLRPAAEVDIVRLGAHRPTFRHDLLRAAATTAVPPSELRSLQMALAASLERDPISLANIAQAVRLRIAALPAGDPQAVAHAAIAVMRRYREATDMAAAADVGFAAATALDAVGGVPAMLTAEVWLDLADCLASLGEVTAATRAYERACEVLGPEDDIYLRARAEAGASQRVIPFVADADRLSRLASIESTLPTGDTPLRVALLGRMAVLGTAIPGGLPAAHKQGDAAIEMARRLGHPSALVDALADRHLVPLGAEGLLASEAAADEVAGLGARVGRPDIELRGAEWQYNSRLDRGDRQGANDALVQLEALAELMASPYWRYSARVRRAAMHVVDGDRAAALETVRAAARIGAGVVEELELTGLELAARVSIMRLWQVPDEGVKALFSDMQRMAGSFGAPFMQVQLATAAAALGHLGPAAGALARLASQPRLVLEAMSGVMTTSLLAELALSVGDVRWVGSLREALTPYADRLGTAIYLPVADILGRLALLDGDPPAAVDHLSEAVAFAAAMPAPVLVARCTQHLADALRLAGDTATATAVAARACDLAVKAGLAMLTPTGHRPAPRPASLRRVDLIWRISVPEGEAQLPHSVGVAQLARLLSVPGIPVAAVDLAGNGPGAQAHDLGPVLDPQAKREFRRRIADLREDIDEAQANNDPGRQERAEAELEALMRALRSAVGLGGRDRPSGSGTERARVNVTRNIRRAIALVAERLPGLGAHLERSVRTGGDCCYDPEPATAMRWEISS